MTHDPHAQLRDRVFERVLSDEGESSPSVRYAAHEGTGLPVDLQPLVEKIHARAYTVSDADIARLRSAYGDDFLFEVIVSAALGASRRRLLAGLKALDDA